MPLWSNFCAWVRIKIADGHAKVCAPSETDRIKFCMILSSDIPTDVSELRINSDIDFEFLFSTSTRETNIFVSLFCKIVVIYMMVVSLD